MKTILPESITTAEDAKAFLSELEANGESFHPDDDPKDIVWSCDPPTAEQCDRLSELMYQCTQIEGFDPCRFLLDNLDL